MADNASNFPPEDDDTENLTDLQRALAEVDDDVLYEVEDDVQVQILDPDDLYETRDQRNVTVGRGSEASARRSSRFHLVSPRVGRTQNDFIRAGIRGSIGSLTLATPLTLVTMVRIVTILTMVVHLFL